MKNRIFKYASIALAVAAGFSLQSCEIDDSAKIDLVELGVPTKEYVVDADACTVDIPYYSNGEFHIEDLKDDQNWIALSSRTGNGDGTLTVECGFNEEFKRSAGLVFCSDVDSRRDTIYVKQKGLIDAVLSLNNSSVIVAGAGGMSSTAVTTNVPFEYMDVKIEYSDENNAGWITDTNIAEDPYGSTACTLEITTDANPEEVKPRTAAVTFSFTDGWGDKVSILVNLVQRNAKEGLGQVLAFDEFINQYSTGKAIDDYVIVEGYVVSNRESWNAGENEQVTTSTINYDISKKTVYFEAKDGSRGIMIEMASIDDNILNQYDCAQILLHGAILTQKDEPERYILSRVTKAMIVSQIAGSKSDIPVKEKYMQELTDADIYTYVSLKDVEFPIRKGAICPTNEGYTIATGAHRIAKYPLLVRDINGNSMYMITNTNCKYRNDGTRLPYGSGKLSGVIVHERFSRFEWRNGADPADMDDDPTLANIGRYSIRHQSKEDIWGQMNNSVEDSFSALLCEYRFVNPDTEEGVLRPTYGENGWLTHTYCEKYTGDANLDYTQATYKIHCWGGGTYDYLGPSGNNVNYQFGANYGNKNGVGIVLDPTKEHYNAAMSDLVSQNPDGTIEWCGQYASNKYAGYGAAGWSESNATNSAYINAINYNGSTSMRGKGNAYGSCFLSAANHFWWNDDTNRFYSWLVKFSTKGISTSHLSMQIYVMNTQQTWFSPRFWRAEWSYTESQDPEDDNQWHTIGDYTIPDVSVWSNTLYSSIVAYKGINFELPTEILGQEEVYIRLHPINNICSDGAEYANAVLSGSSKGTSLATEHASNLSYFAIRYNK